MPAGDACAKGTVYLPACRFRAGRWDAFEEKVSVEVALFIYWRDTLLQKEGTAELWAWPESLASLALGHVLLDVVREGNTLAREVAVEEVGETQFSITLGEQLANPLPDLPARVDAGDLFEAMHAFISAEGQWESTGCFHRAGLYDPGEQRLLLRTEDIGRHNCLDRIAGWSALNAVPLADKVLLTSARITASLCAKALRAGFRFMVSRSAVTTAAVSLAGRHGVTLVGFARTDEKRFTVFTDAPERIRRTGD